MNKNLNILLRGLERDHEGVCEKLSLGQKSPLLTDGGGEI